VRGTYLLLLHQFGIGTVVHDVLAENRRGKRRIHLLGIHILQFAIQDELIAFCSQAYCGFLAQQDKRKHVSVLFAAGKEEFERIHAI
jgi:hypothetical protein